MTQLNEEHFELHDANKAKRHQEQKIKYLEDRIKTLEKTLESHAKILARFQMTEGDKWNIVKDRNAILTTHRTGNEDRKEIRKIKLEEEVAFITCKGTRVQCNAKAIGLRSLGNKL